MLDALIIVFVLLIAYWWANQGAFSAFLHLVCVIIAGALTLALWEPISVALLPKLKDHTWCVVFLGLFAVSLFVFRILFDRFVPGNLNFPTPVNLVVGGLFGAVAGVLTVGMLVVGMGFSQSTNQLLGHYGWVRLPQEGGRPVKSQGLILPVHQLTTGFYGMLSQGALSPHTRTALATYYPDLAASALSLHRDTWKSGTGRTSVPPDSIDLQGLTYDPSFQCEDGSTGAYALQLTFDSAAFDGGQGLTLSASQAKLVGVGADGKPAIVHPVAFTEDLDSGGRGTFQFDDNQNYATNARAQQRASVDLIFPSSKLSGVSFAMVKGLRLKLPPQREQPGGISALAGSSAATARVTHLSGDGAPPLAENELKQENSLQPLQIGINQASGLDILQDEKKGNPVRGGEGNFQKRGSFSVSRGQRVTRFDCATGTDVLRLEVTRGLATVDFGEVKKQYGPGERLLLVDSEDRGYAASGYVWDMGSEVQVSYDPVALKPALKDFPEQSSGGTQKLWIVFVVPKGAKITQVRVGEDVVATVELEVEDR